MLASITPLGERGRGNRYGITALWFVAGATIGGALLGAAASALGHLSGLDRLPSSMAGCVLAIAAVLATVDGWRGRRFLPSPRRQVDERWLDRYRSWVYGVGFGFQLGLGVTTVVPAGCFHLAVVAAVLAPAPWGVAVGVAFGLARGLSILLASSVKAPTDLLGLHRRLEGRAGTVLASCRAITTVVAVAALAAAVTA